MPQTARPQSGKEDISQVLSLTRQAAMGCGASTNSVVDYAHGVAPGGRRAISSSDVLDSSMDSLESGMEHQEVPTPVMDSMWALRMQAADTADLKEVSGVKTQVGTNLLVLTIAHLSSCRCWDCSRGICTGA